jgi:multidrug efflux pump subunit AcrB
MQLPRRSIENTSFTWMLFIFLVIIGLRSLLLMPRTENPEVTIPGSSIVVVMPGAGPVDMEKLVSLPIEEALNELEDISRISSTVRDGYATISVEFDFNTDADNKYDEVVRQFNSIRNELPGEIARVELWKWSTSDVAMFQIALISETAGIDALEEQAEKLKKQLEKVRNVRKVNLVALPEQEIHIDLDLELMARVNTTLEMVTNAINSNNANIPGGEVTIGGRSLNVRSSGAYSSLEEIRNTVVNSYQGKMIRLEDIAEVNFGVEELDYLARFGGDRSDKSRKTASRAIFMTVSQKEGFNVLQTSDALMPIVAKFREQLPDDMYIEMIFDQPAKVRDRINNFLFNLLQGIILVGVVIFVSLGFRSSLVVVLAIPLSIVISLGFLDLSGYGLQQISIAGLIVALGLLVDNSIVMVENIDRFRTQGYSRREASYRGAAEIGWPVVAATLTTILAFIPIATMPDMTGAFIRSLPLTISITLAVSLLIALTLTPTITSRIYRETDPDASKRKGTKKFLKWIAEHPYRKSLVFSLEKPFLVILVALALLAGSGYFFTYIGISFFPKAEQANLMIRAKLPEGSSLERTDKVARHIESVLDTVPEVKYYASNVGHGNPRIYYNVFPRGFDQAIAEFYVELDGYEPESFALTLQRLRNLFSGYPGARISVREFEQGPPFESAIQVYVTGDDLDQLRKISADVEEMLAEKPGVINLENHIVKTNTELLFDINRDKANIYGVPLVEIDRTIRTAVTGIDIAEFRDASGDQYDIILRMKGAELFTPADLEKIYVSSLSGRQIPLKQFVDLKLQQSSSMISRYNLERTAQVVADVATGYNMDEIMEPVIAQLDAYPFPEGFDYSIGGELEGRQEAFGGMANAIMIAVLTIFAVLVFQFRSFKQPLIIFLAIPFAGIGMIWALLITGYSFSFTAFVGLTSLIGIVVNNSIILVDYTNKLRKSGRKLDEAIRIAAETRLIPIVLTAFTTIGGLLPLTLRGGTLWAPMGWTIIGGLLVSTLFTLIVVPVFYKILEKEEVSSS